MNQVTEFTQPLIKTYFNTVVLIVCGHGGQGVKPLFLQLKETTGKGSSFLVIEIKKTLV